MSRREGPTETLALFAANLARDAIPQEVRHQAIRVIYDTLTCIVAGSTSDSAKIFKSVLLNEFGARDESSLIPDGEKTSAPVAAFVNAMSGNARDLDDNLLYHSHISNTIVAAATAVAEGEDASGEDLIVAVVAGFEVAARVSLSMPGVPWIEESGEMGWPNPYGHSYNVLGAVSATGRLLKLDADEMASALGLAGYSAPVPSLTKVTALPRLPMSKYGAYGWQAWSACMSARLAQAGMTGDASVLDGPFGFWRMMGAHKHDSAVLTSGLGSDWWIMSTSFMTEPAGTWMRPAIRALRNVMEVNRLSPDDIDQVIVRLVVVRPDGVFVNTDVKSYLDTQVGYQYLLAVTALQIEGEKWQLSDTYGDPRVHDMMSRIHLHSDGESERILRADLSKPPYRARGTLTSIEVQTKAGSFESSARYGDGDPFDPDTELNDSGLDDKFRRFAAPLLPSDRVVDVLEAVWSLEELDSSKRFVRAFCR